MHRLLNLAGLGFVDEHYAYASADRDKTSIIVHVHVHVYMYICRERLIIPNGQHNFLRLKLVVNAQHQYSIPGH